MNLQSLILSRSAKVRGPKLTKSVAFLAALFLPAGAQAQTLSDCRQIENDVNRLMCYDRIQNEISSSNKAQEGIIASFTGSGTHAVRPFAASGSWEMEWSVDNSSILIAVHDINGKILAKYGVGERSSKGHAYWPNDGVFSLEIITAGKWHIQIKSVR